MQPVTRFVLNLDLEPLDPPTDFQSLSHPIQWVQSQFDQSHTIKRSNPNSLLDLLSYAYGHHQPIKLKPDDIWIQFMSQFALNVNSEPEFYREVFADKNNLNTRTEISVFFNVENIKDVPIDDFINEVISVLKTKVNQGNLVEDLQADFSTSTIFTKLATGIIFMYTVEKYFSFKVLLSCGIPFIDLAGTADDWILLQKKIQLVANIAHPLIKNWCEVACNTIGCVSRCIEANNGGNEVDFMADPVNTTDFMSKIFYTEKCGSGSQTCIRGWILNFFLYDKKLSKTINANNIFADDYPECRTKCQINCRQINYELHGGFYGFNRFNSGSECLELITGYHLQKPEFVGWTFDGVHTQLKLIQFDQSTYHRIKYNNNLIHNFYSNPNINAKFCKWKSINNTDYDFNNIQIYYSNDTFTFVLLHRFDSNKWICAIETMFINGSIQTNRGWSLTSLERIQKDSVKIYP